MIDFGTGVVLGPLESEFIELIRSWRNDWAVWRWCRQNDVITYWDQTTWFAKQQDDPTIRMYMIYGDGKPVGVAGLTSIDLINRRAEFSVYIAPQWRGQKFGQKALSTLLSHGFLNLGLHSIWGESFQGNPAIKTFKELGFKQDGFLRDFYFREGEFIDAVRFSILDCEWTALSEYTTQKVCSTRSPSSV